MLVTNMQIEVWNVYAVCLIL